MTLLKKKPKNVSDEMTFMEHLGELRRRLIIAGLSIFGAVVVAFFIYTYLIHFLVKPLCDVKPKNCQLIALSPLDGLAIRMKISFYCGLILSSPMWTWQIWSFITPGLTKKEKRYAIPIIISAIVFFIFGCVVAFITYPHALGFLSNIGGTEITPSYTADRYINLLLNLMGIFGLTFEFPVILLGLMLVNVITPQQLSKIRKWAIVGVTAAGAILTPSSDPFSMFALAVPLYIFYEGAIIVGRIVKRKKKKSISENS